jgi:hypothetical protein
MADPDLPLLKARAEAMRRAGATMAEIARVVGRAPSTLHQWAAAGGWRLAEIETAGLVDGAANQNNPDSQDVFLGPISPTLNKAGPGQSMAPEDGPQGQALGSGAMWAVRASPLTPLEAAKALHQRSGQLAAAGEVRAAEAAARLAERILRTEYHLTRIAGPPEKSAAERAQEVAEIRAEIERRLDRIRAARAEWGNG